jgi:hypothetical protein
MIEISNRVRGGRHGIAPVIIAVILVAIIMVAGVAVYFFAIVTPSGSPSTSQSTQTSTAGSSTTSTLRTSSTSLTTGSSVRTSSTGSANVTNYSGSFNYTNPEGPSGERVFSNNTVQTYGSVQYAVGSFTFSINSLNYSGLGSGHGTMTVTTVGFCSGKVTFPYVFSVQATQLPGQNITLGFSGPTPANATVPLSCTGPMAGVSTATNEPVPFLAEYPGLITTATVPVTIDKNLGYGVTYYYNIVLAS